MNMLEGEELVDVITPKDLRTLFSSDTFLENVKEAAEKTRRKEIETGFWIYKLLLGGIFIGSIF